MLAMNVQQLLSQFLQRLQGDRVSVDKCPGASIGIDDAAKPAFVVLLQGLFVKPVLCFGHVRKTELSAELGTFRADTHKAIAAAFSQNQPQCVHKNRFAGACFPGKDRHAFVKVDFHLIDNREVTNLQTSEHGLTTPVIVDASPNTAVPAPVQL